MHVPDRRRDHCRRVFVWAATPLLLSLSCAKRGPRADPLALPEDPYGVAGAPIDESSFDFEPDASVAAVPPVLDGIPPTPDELRSALAPYLAVHRVRLDGTLAYRGERAFLVRARLGQITQAYALSQPLGELVALTDEREPLVQVASAPGPDDALLMRLDSGGDERDQLYWFDLASRRRTRLTDGTSRHGPFAVARGEQRIAFTGNARNPADMEIWVASGRRLQHRKIVADTKGLWVIGAWSPTGRWLVAREYRSSEDSRLHLLDTRTGRLRQVAPTAGIATCLGGAFSPDGSQLYFMSDEGGEYRELLQLDLSSGDVVRRSHDLPWDVEHVSVGGSRVAFTANEGGYSAIYVIDLDTGERRRLDDIPRGVVSTLWLRNGGDEVALELATPTAPSDVVTYDLTRGVLVRWTDSSPDAATVQTEPEHLDYTALDGLRIPAFYFRPRAEGPFPVLLWMHGGPDSQFRPTYHPFIQYLVARGIAVIAPNVRGSSGYGRRFRGLDNGLLRGEAVADVGALLGWIAMRPELDGRRVAMHGGSYGGFIVLSALVRYGDRIVAGSDYVGISDLPTFLDGTAAYRQEHRRAEYGDERDPKLRERLADLSAYRHADRIVSALFVAHGANDPRVPAAQAEQIVAAVRANHRTAWYMLASDEGHGFRRRTTRDRYYEVLAHFLEIHLRPT